ncbi:MAG: hypothetical protein H6667_19445 [Ardenticatenaceae bacterium]|nr:hypothetical protein [Ardenticatenaceae bacterium]
MKIGWRQRLALLVILWLATGLRFYRLEAQSFWNDEGNSARLSERSIPAIIEGTASDIHPPLYYLILHGWRKLVGDSEFGLRSFSAFAGVLTVAVTIALGKEFRTRMNANKRRFLFLSASSVFIRVPLLAGLLTAVSPPLIYYSQETRMYSLLVLLAVLATWLLLRWQSCVMRHTSCVKWLIGYGLCAVTGLYTQYFFAAVLITHNLLVLLWLINKRKETGVWKSLSPLLPCSPTPLLHWFAIMLAAALAYLPWLPIFLNQTGGRPGMRESALTFLLEMGRWLALGSTIEAGTAVLPLIAAAVLMIYGLMISRNWTIVLGLLIPTLFMFTAGATQPQYFKFMTVAVPFFCLLIAAAFNRRGRGERRGSFLFSAFSAVFFLLLLVGNGRSLQNLYFNPSYARADYRGMAARIEAENHPNAGIILDAPNQWEVFTYYHRDGAPVYPIPTGRPLPDKINAELTEIAARHDRLYVIFWGEAQRDPELLVERWLDEHAFKATDEWIGDVRFVTYAVPSEPAAEMATAVHLPFGDAITLKGYTLASDQLAPGDIVQITLFWETAVPLDTRYKVFLHLVDANGQLVAQRDSEPGGGLNPTTRWPPGETIIDNHGILIPADLPPGTYSLLLGLYDLTDPAQRLPIQAETGIVDAFSVARISVSN